MTRVCVGRKVRGNVRKRGDRSKDCEISGERGETATRRRRDVGFGKQGESEGIPIDRDRERESVTRTPVGRYTRETRVTEALGSVGGKRPRSERITTRTESMPEVSIDAVDR